MLTDFVTDEYAVFERNENYWGEAPAIQKITVKVIPDNQTRIMALENEEIDLIFGKNMLDADAISQYVEGMNPVLYQLLADGRKDFLLDHTRFEEDMRMAQDSLEKCL